MKRDVHHTRKDTVFLPHHPHVGFQVKTRGWTIEVKGDREVQVSDTVRGFADVGHIDEDGVVHYSQPEHVPKDVRTTVKILSRKMLARGVQH